MLKVGSLLKFLLDLNPQKTPARLALYNWLRGFASPDEPLTRELFEGFFTDCLDFPHWVGNKTQLGHEVRFLIENFNKFYQQKFDLTSLRFPEESQVLELEHTQDVQDALACHLNTLMGPDDKFRLINDQNKRFLAVVLRSDRSLEVRVYNRKFTLRGGILEPLRTDLVLFYDSNLELSSTHQHKMEIAPYITAQFTLERGEVTGQALRGFVFQKLMEFNGEALNSLPKLLLPLRRLEQFFVDRESDRDYQELIQKLERTRALIQAGDKEALRFGAGILTQAETSLEQVYTGDRLLSLMIRDLRHSLQPEGTSPWPTLNPLESDSTN